MRRSRKQKEKQKEEQQEEAAAEEGSSRRSIRSSRRSRGRSNGGVEQAAGGCHLQENLMWWMVLSFGPDVHQGMRYFTEKYSDTQSF